MCPHKISQDHVRPISIAFDEQLLREIFLWKSCDFNENKSLPIFVLAVSFKAFLKKEMK